MRIIRAVVRYLQQLMREDAYAVYCAHLRSTNCEAPLPTPQQFYLESIERRYKGVSRCC